MGEQLRRLSQDCFRACIAKTEVVTFSDQESECMGRCQERMLKVRERVERHAADAFTPQFFLKFIQDQ